MSTAVTSWPVREGDIVYPPPVTTRLQQWMQMALPQHWTVNDTSVWFVHIRHETAHLAISSPTVLSYITIPPFIISQMSSGKGVEATKCARLRFRVVAGHGSTGPGIDAVRS
jgi:hypothetical protein